MLLELLLVGMSAVIIGKIAEADDETGILWGMLTAIAGGLCLFLIPFPYYRVLIALGIIVPLMIVWRFLRR